MPATISEVNSLIRKGLSERNTVVGLSDTPAVTIFYDGRVWSIGREIATARPITLTEHDVILMNTTAFEAEGILNHLEAPGSSHMSSHKTGYSPPQVGEEMFLVINQNRRNAPEIVIDSVGPEGISYTDSHGDSTFFPWHRINSVTQGEDKRELHITITR